MPTISLSPGGKRFEAAPSEPVLDAALRAGVAVPYGCRNGACRSCEAGLVDGEIVYPHGPPQALDTAERAAGRILLCRAVAVGDVTVEVEEIDPSGEIRVRRLPCRVLSRRALAHDVVGLELGLQAGERLRFRAGQYLDIVLRDGRRRAFSIASPPHRSDALELHVRRIPGGRFSGRILDELRAGALLRIEGPLGNFWLRGDHDRPAVLIAGGTGFAPIKSIVEDALHAGLERPVHLYRGVRARRDLYLDDLCRRWASTTAKLAYVPVLSEPGPDDAWRGRRGFVHEAVLADFPELSACSIYMSGPPPMVEAGRRAFPARGADPAHLHSDAFDYAWQTGHDDVGR